ncbi:MAG: tetrahydromethanopterin S-methyltransferase subunit A [Nitrososphaeraceae archaeon]
MRNSPDIMKKIIIVGRLLSENKGIDKIIEYVNYNSDLKFIILCGRDAKGHKPGEALISLKYNGIDSKKRILYTRSPYSKLKSSYANIEKFRKQIEIIDCIGLKNIKNIKLIVNANS